jgi:hypothetical protein
MKAFNLKRKLILVALFASIFLSTLSIHADGFPPILPPPVGGNPGGGNAPVPPIVLPVE